MAIDPDTQARPRHDPAGGPPAVRNPNARTKRARPIPPAARCCSRRPKTSRKRRDTTVAGPHWVHRRPPVPSRRHRGVGRLPALIYYHGGGWLLGDLDSHDGVCRRFANAAQCRGRFRRLPYGARAQSSRPRSTIALAATRYVFDNARCSASIRRKVAVGGDSAGGNLAAVMALMARDGRCRQWRSSC